MDDRYGTDVLAAGWRQQHARTLPEIEATPDLVVEVAADGYCGAVVGVASGMVELEDRHGRRRLFPLGPGLPRRRRRCRPRGARGRDGATATRRTASGSFAVADAQGAHRPREPDLRRGPARRGTRREGVGRRSARRGRRRRVSAGDRPARGCARRRAAERRASLRGAGRPSRAGFQGVPHRGGGRPRSPRRARAHRRSPVDRRVAVRALRGRSASRAGPTSRAASSSRSACAARSAGPPETRPTSRAPGSGSWARCRAIATSSPNCSAGSRSSSTS